MGPTTQRSKRPHFTVASRNHQHRIPPPPSLPASVPCPPFAAAPPVFGAVRGRPSTVPTAGMPSEFKAAASSLRKVMGSSSSLFCKSFNSSKCKTEAKLAVARIKLLRNRREVQVRQMRRDVAMLLQSHQDSTARIRVEHVIREQNIMAANEIIELFCELIVVRLPIIAKQRDCPADLKEGISSVIFAAPRCSDIPELLRLRDIFEKKYGKDFVAAATDLRPETGVNRTLIEKLSVRTPSGEIKMKVMKEIAKEFQIEWDTTESELELLKPPEKPLEGPKTFVSASSMPLNPPLHGVLTGEYIPKQPTCTNMPELRYSKDKDNTFLQFKDTASAAQAAMELAEQAKVAARAAAHLAKKEMQQELHMAYNMRNSHDSSLDVIEGGGPVNSFDSNHEFPSARRLSKESKLQREIYGMPSHGSREVSDDEMDPTNMGSGRIQRRHSSNAHPPRHIDIRFDDSDGLDLECEEEFETRKHSEGGHLPPSRPPPALPPSESSKSPTATAISRVHPKLPDYDELTARFEALRRSRS